jgi:hypothetical protein
MKHSYLITFSAIIVFGTGMLIATAEVPDWAKDGAWLTGQAEPVLVVLVGDKRNLQLVRAAISDERIVAETEGGFALVEERVVAANAEAAAGALTLAGWIDREIDLVAVPMDGGRRWMRERNKQKKGAAGSAGGAGAAEEDPEKAARVAELMSKPTLTSGEAMFVLQHMDETGQF